MRPDKILGDSETCHLESEMSGGGSSRQREEVEKECAKAVKEFRRVFGESARPELGAYAPGRVNLMGGSIDYTGGPVIPVVRTRHP